MGRSITKRQTGHEVFISFVDRQVISNCTIRVALTNLSTAWRSEAIRQAYSLHARNGEEIYPGDKDGEVGKQSVCHFARRATDQLLNL